MTRFRESGSCLELHGVEKRFGATPALCQVSLALRSGEIQVIAGANGAGKSTLIKVMSGVHAPDGGTIRWLGRCVRWQSPRQAQRAGIATIHQELGLVGPLSITDNFSLSEPGSLWGRGHPPGLRRKVRTSLDALELDLDPGQPVETLSLAQQQLVEIARALACRARVLILDEPTSALGESDATRLFTQLSRLRAAGVAIAYISHRLDEIYRLASNITVLRDGRIVASAPAAELPRSKLVEAMVGHDVRSSRERRHSTGGKTALRIQRLTLPHPLRPRPLVDDVSLSIGQGEVVGLGGLCGSGGSELLRALFGVFPDVRLSGFEIGEVHYSRPDPASSIAGGLVLLAGDRQLSVLRDLTLVENASLSSLPRYCRMQWVNRAREMAESQAVGQRIGLRGYDPEQRAGTLSGGNQQKLALTRCLLARPRVLLLDEPTRGIDVAAKADVHAQIRREANAGMAILLVASEAEELVDLCDRVLVLARGRIVAHLRGPQITRESILQAALSNGSEAA